MMMRSLLAVCILAMAAPAAAFAPGSVPTLRSARAPAISMQKKVDILDKIEQLEVLTALSKSGILSKLERSRTLTKLENSGLLSTVEKLLPIVDEAGIISLTKTLVNTSPGILNAVWFGLILLPAAIVALVPDTNNGLVAVQVVSVPLCISLAAPLYFGAQVLKVIQGDEKVDLSGISKLLD